MTRAYHRSFFLAGPAGNLEALLWTAVHDRGTHAALVCHPHPLYGGTLHNKVVFQAAKTLHRLHIPTLRFNFRGVGLSEGEHDAGRGEHNDVRAALDFLAAEFPGRSLLLAGFSFGSAVGLRAGCEDPRVTELIGLGLPVNRFPFSYLAQCHKPKLFVQGEQDEHGALSILEALNAALPHPAQIVAVPDADHFFTGRLHEVDEALRGWLLERHPEWRA